MARGCRKKEQQQKKYFPLAKELSQQFQTF
jgi:hypothetical protein